MMVYIETSVLLRLDSTAECYADKGHNFREMPRVAFYSKREGVTLLRDLIYTDIFNTP